MRIALIDTFYDTSHRYWAEGLIQHLDHEITVYMNKPHNWKWQMVGGVLNFIGEINLSDPYDLIIASDMVNLPLLKSSLDPIHQDTPILLYFHENQITYPWSPTDIDIKKERDHHYGWINYMSAILADGVAFNSNYHKRSFIDSLPGFIKMFPKFDIPLSIAGIEEKSSVLPIGIKGSASNHRAADLPTFIWNHRWEYDKNPEDFFQALFQLSHKKIAFDLIVVGKEYKNCPPIFKEARERLASHIIHWGWVKSKAEYLRLIDRSNILLVTSYQDFFGISIVEAIAFGCHPILPNRLSYPEHIPHECQDESLYEDHDTMMTLLKEVINSKSYTMTNRYKDYIQRYNWEQLILIYETVFSKIKKPST